MEQVIETEYLSSRSSGECRNILGYPIIGKVKTAAGIYPLVDIPMMSDERWQQLAKQNAVHNYIREYGHEPESAEAALK